MNMKSWTIIERIKDWRGRYREKSKTYRTEKSFRSAVARIGTYKREDSEYIVQVWEMTEQFSMDSYVTEAKRATQIETITGDPYLAELSDGIVSLFSEEFEALVGEWMLVDKASNVDIRNFLSKWRAELQLYPTMIDGVDYLSWWSLLLRFSNYQKLADNLYISYKRSAKATPELSKEFDAVRTAARKNRKR